MVCIRLKGSLVWLLILQMSVLGFNLLCFVLLCMFYVGREEGCCNLLVATDVAQEGLDMPSCNFVIRYNFVSNEIGSVQSKGRARARDSECYLIVERHSTSERRELDNLRKEELMMKALSAFDQMPRDELRQKIANQQVGYYYYYYYF